MLENVHLAPGWLMQLEKKLHSMQPHASFRLFLTMEINPKVNYIYAECYNLHKIELYDVIQPESSLPLSLLTVSVLCLPARCL